jgi:hypothetical protein
MRCGQTQLLPFSAAQSDGYRACIRPRPRSPSVTNVANSGLALVAGCGQILIGLS